MDETFLTDLLECSVCLEQLDATSKVLPCQHTFCKRCLEEIVISRKELRCPECRVLVLTPIEDLPSNILLIRLLEGLKHNSKRDITRSLPHPFLDEKPGSQFVPTFPQTPQRAMPTNSTVLSMKQQSCSQPTIKPIAPPQSSQNVIKPSSLSPGLPRAKALYNYDGKEPG